MTGWRVGCVQWLGGRTNEWHDDIGDRAICCEQFNVIEPFEYM